MSYISELLLALSVNNITNGSSDEDYILETLENKFTQTQLNVITKILSENTMGICDIDIESVIDNIEKLISEVVAANNKNNIINSFFELFSFLLVKCNSNNIIAPKLQKILSPKGKILSDSNLDLSLKTNIALKFLDYEKYNDIAVPWVIEYFSRSKSTHIDLNRYKIEAFLVNPDDNRFDNYIIFALRDDDRHIREHMADIIGEKKITKAAPNLREQLKVEDNLYSAASIIEALGKVGIDEDIVLINEWIKKNFNEINNPGGNFVFKHAHHAIMSLDMSNSKEKACQYIHTYGDYFTH